MNFDNLNFLWPYFFFFLNGEFYEKWIVVSG